MEIKKKQMVTNVKLGQFVNKHIKFQCRIIVESFISDNFFYCTKVCLWYTVRGLGLEVTGWLGTLQIGWQWFFKWRHFLEGKTGWKAEKSGVKKLTRRQKKYYVSSFQQGSRFASQ